MNRLRSRKGWLIVTLRGLVVGTGTGPVETSCREERLRAGRGNGEVKAKSNQEGLNRVLMLLPKSDTNWSGLFSISLCCSAAWLRARNVGAVNSHAMTTD